MLNKQKLFKKLGLKNQEKLKAKELDDGLKELTRNN